MTTLRPDTIQLFDRTREVHVSGPSKRIPIWAVVVDDEAYVRSYRGEGGAWFRRARRDGRMTLEGVDVRVEPEQDSALNERVSEAFRAKYGARSRESTESMVSPEVVATTLRLTSAD